MDNNIITKLCEKYNIENYTINDDGTIDVHGGVHLNNNALKKLPLKFRYVSNYFHCSNNQLTTLEGCPQIVGGRFSCSHNQLTTLEGSPQTVSGNFWCNNNPLSLKNYSSDYVKSYIKQLYRNKKLNELLHD